MLDKVNYARITITHVCFIALTLANVNIKHPISVSLRYLKTHLFPKKACSDVSRFILSSIFTSDPNLTDLTDVFHLLTTIVYLAIQVACFDAIFGRITDMIGHLFYLHIVKSTANDRQGFFIMTSTSHFSFSYVFIL